jgi:hypothetical protein
VYISFSEDCSVFPKEIYNLEQSILVDVDYLLIKSNGRVVDLENHEHRKRNVHLKYDSLLVGVIDYCSVMDTKIDAAFYSAILSIDVIGRYENSVELCFVEFYNGTIDDIDSVKTKIQEDPHECVVVEVNHHKLEFQLKNVLRYMFTKPRGTLSLFTLRTVSNDDCYPRRSRDIRLRLKDDDEESNAKLELIVPSIPIPGPMLEIPSENGDDYSHLFPGSEFHHICTIPDEELRGNHTNPSKCFGRDIQLLRPLEENPLGLCIKVYTDGMPSLGAMHHSRVNNQVHIPGEDPYLPNKYCVVVVTTRLGSGTNTPTPTQSEWSWSLPAQMREQLRLFVKIKEMFPEAVSFHVESHDRDSIATQGNIFPEITNAWAEAYGWETLDSPITSVTLRDAWISVCKDEERFDGVCSESTLFGGLPAPYKPVNACELAIQWGVLSPSDPCECEDNLFLTPFITEWGEEDSENLDHPEGYRECMWRHEGYEFNYNFYDNLEDPNSTWRICAAKWRDPFTDDVVPASGFLFNGAFQLAYDFSTCTPSSSGLSSFNPQVATPGTVLPAEELAIFSYGSECETRFNSTLEQYKACTDRRFGKSKDPKGAVFNTEWHRTKVFEENGLTGVETYRLLNEAFKNGTDNVRVILYHTGPKGLLNANRDPEFLRTFDNTYVVETRGYYSHFMSPDNPYACNVIEQYLDIKFGIIPDESVV